MEDIGIRNYYERYVMDEINHTLRSSGRITEKHMALDIACLALNQLPPKYVRHDIDATFYMSPEDRGDIESKVAAAVAGAYQKVIANPGRA